MASCSKDEVRKLAYPQPAHIVISQNTKLLSIISLLIVFAGVGLLWYGSNPKALPEASSTPLVRNTEEAASSTTLTASTSAVVGIEGERVVVTKVIDGDTVKLENGKTVRLLGIDTPETKHPKKSVECFGKEASAETKNLLEGKIVVLEKDISETDKYNRLLRYIYLPLDNGQILFVQDYLVREGFATALTFPPDVKFSEQLREAERFAKEENKGLWSKCK